MLQHGCGLRIVDVPCALHCNGSSQQSAGSVQHPVFAPHSNEALHDPRLLLTSFADGTVAPWNRTPSQIDMASQPDALGPVGNALMAILLFVLCAGCVFFTGRLLESVSACWEEVCRAARGAAAAGQTALQSMSSCGCITRPSPPPSLPLCSRPPIPGRHGASHP